MSSDGLAVELSPPQGRTARIEWDQGALRSLAELGGETPLTWSLGREPDWERLEALRVLSAAFEDGTLVAIAALRPADVPGHDAEVVSGLLLEPGGEAQPVEEVLISTEFGPDGAERRLGLELYADPDGPPKRVVADRDTSRVGTSLVTDRERHYTGMDFRMEGMRGYGLLDVLRRR